MDQEQFDALLAYIDARIDEKIQQAFGRDSLSDGIRAEYLKDGAQKLIVED